MNIFEKEIMRRVKECDCDAVYRERDNSVSVTYDETKIAKIRDGKCEKTFELTDEEFKKFLHVKRLCENVSNYCSAYENGEPINIPNFSDGYRIIFHVSIIIPYSEEFFKIFTSSRLNTTCSPLYIENIFCMCYS